MSSTPSWTPWTSCESPVADLPQLRLKIIESLAKAYDAADAQPLAEGYYSGFLSKLYRIMYGAAEDFGLAPQAFYIVSVVEPLGQALRGIGIVTKQAPLRNAEAAVFFLREALRDLEESEPTNL